MLMKIKRIFPKEGFNRNVLTLMTGTGISQIIPLAVTPILTRIYSPEQFGVFALFIAIASSLSTVATGRYELAIMLPRKDTDAANITILSMAINCFVSSLLFIIAWLFNDQISNLLGSRSISTWLYFVPLSVFLNGIYLSLNYWSNRKKLYTLMANRRIIHSCGTAGVQLGLGMLQAGSAGLVFGSISGQALAVGIMGKMIYNNNQKIYKNIDKIKILALAKRYKNYPKFLVPAHTLNAFSVQLPLIFINSIFGLATSGFFMLAERVVSSPISLISGSIADVFRQQISQSYITDRNCKAEFESALKKLIIISIPPFTVFAIVSPYLFSFLFGEKWSISGEYAQIMSPMFFIRFITNPLSNVAIIAQKNRYELYLQIALLMLLIAATLIDHAILHDAKNFIILFTIIYSTYHIIDLIANYKFACEHYFKK